jgi:predicted PurR-regulated permease PerM
MSYLKINSKNIIILVLNILFIYMLFYNLFYKKKESFSVNDIDNVVGDIKNVTKSIEKIPDEINNIDKKLTQQVTNVESTILKKTEEMGKEIEKNTTNMLKEKLQSFVATGLIPRSRDPCDGKGREDSREATHPRKKSLPGLSK